MKSKQECGPAGEHKSVCLIACTLKESLVLNSPAPFFLTVLSSPTLALLNSQKLNPAIQFHCVDFHAIHSAGVTKHLMHTKYLDRAVLAFLALPPNT